MWLSFNLHLIVVCLAFILWLRQLWKFVHLRGEFYTVCFVQVHFLLNARKFFDIECINLLNLATVNDRRSCRLDLFIDQKCLGSLFKCRRSRKIGLKNLFDDKIVISLIDIILTTVVWREVFTLDLSNTFVFRHFNEIYNSLFVTLLQTWAMGTLLKVLTEETLTFFLEI